MSILLTGANGFLGRNILRAFGDDQPFTLGLTGCDINVDLSRNVPEFNDHFEKVIHAAGLAHTLPFTDEAARRFFSVNTHGTENLLKGLEKLHPLPRIFIFISTVAVYGLDEGEKIDESAPLNGVTPYALSKIEAENLISSWGREHGVSTLILRLPLIAGVNPPGNLGSMIKAIQKRYYLRPGNGSARKSMVLASDVAAFLNGCRQQTGIYNLTDGHHPSVRELDEAIARCFNRRIRQIPGPLLRIVASAGDLLHFLPLDTSRLQKLTSSLTFSDQRARNEIGWISNPVVQSRDF
jgi:nucleoside-diphosphate-sugar epimerase